MTAQLKDLTRLKQPVKSRSGQVKISYGVHSLEAAIAGKSVAEVRQALKEPLNIDPRALALVNGKDVPAAYVLKEGDQLEFVRLAGEKGLIKTRD
jgi:sulfur carrier protein ThiS